MKFYLFYLFLHFNFIRISIWKGDHWGIKEMAKNHFKYGDPIDFKWWQYIKAGTYSGKVLIPNPN